MTRAEYHATRVLPERKRATRNGKRSIDAFVKSVRDRTAVENPQWLEAFDTDLSRRLIMLYFYFTKYVTARWNTDGMTVVAACSDMDNTWVTDNLLDDSRYAKIERKAYYKLLVDALHEIDKERSPCYDGAEV